MAPPLRKTHLGLPRRVFAGIVVVGLLVPIVAYIAISNARTETAAPIYEAMGAHWRTAEYHGVLVLSPDQPQVTMAFESSLREPAESIEVLLDQSAATAVVTPTVGGSGLISFELAAGVETAVEVEWTIRAAELPRPGQTESPILKLDQPPDSTLAGSG